MVSLHHARQELLREIVVGERVDLERQVEVFLSGVDNCLAARDTSIVNQDGRVAECAADLRGGICDG